MNSNEILSKIETNLYPGEKILAIYEATLLENWVKTSKILSMVENLSSYGFFVFSIICDVSNQITSVVLHDVFPINSEFEINVAENSSDISVNVTVGKKILVFEMEACEKTRNFIIELCKIIEMSSKKENSLDHSWLHKYKNQTSRLQDSEGTFQSYKNNEPTDENSINSELFIPRHLIAKGNTPIAGRESAVRYQMALKENDYTYTQVIKIFVGTWNVNGQLPSVSLSDWLNIDPEPPDIYAIGFQELDLSKEAFLFNDSPREEEWLAAVIVSLHSKGKYRKIASVRLVGMMLLVFIREQHVAYVRGVATDTVGTGIMGKLGNKGGVAVRFDLHNTSICFVNAHLAAHVEEYERRNQDYHDICSRISFPKFLPPKTIKDHDQIFWFGDFNYRITELDPFTVKSLVESKNYDAVLIYDQLKQNYNLGKVFEKYKEGHIEFKPTYKYDVGTDEWDSSEKNRAPAWCDRILWKGNKINQIYYRSHSSLKISDHKPVSALFNSEIRVIDAAKYRKIHEDIMKKLDKLENEFLPQVMVDTTEVHFNDVSFQESQSKDLIIANTGQVPVQFEFIKKLDDSSYCKGWLHIEPYAGLIMPGEKCDIKLEVYVDKRYASELNSGRDKLYDILVLHLEGGKDIFITVNGNYNYGCFGMSLDVLSRIKVPVSELSREELIDLEKNKDYLSDPYPVPKEIWYLVDHLYRHGMKQHHVFEQPGLHSELLQIRDWLNTGMPDQIPGSIHSVAEALLLLLDSTTEPIIPYSMHADCLNASANYVQCKQIITMLPTVNRTVFLYLCAFLQEFLSHSAENNADTKTIAALFGSLFLRDLPISKYYDQSTVNRTRAAQQLADRKKANFMHHFLVNDQSDLIMNCL